MPQFLLVTDLDNTLIGDNEATLNLIEHLLPHRDRFYLFYATGRNFDSVAHLLGFFQLLTHTPLLTPDYVIASVGTAIYHRSYPEPGWTKYIDRDWQRDKIAHLLHNFPGLIPQSDREQNPWKLSFYLTTKDDTITVSKIRELLSANQVACHITFSHRNTLDITPPHAHKGSAILWLQQQLGISHLPTLVCGDSGNDITMYQPPFYGVIVRNAQPELLQWYCQQQSDRILLSQYDYAAAILEALHYFALL